MQRCFTLCELTWLLITVGTGLAAPLESPVDLSSEGQTQYFSLTVDCERGPLVLTLDGEKHWTRPLAVGLDDARRPMARLLTTEVTAVTPVPKGVTRLVGKVVTHAAGPDEVLVKVVVPDATVPEPMSDADWTLVCRAVSADCVLASFFADRVNTASGTFVDVAFGATWADVTRPLPSNPGTAKGRFGDALDADMGIGLTPGCDAFNARVLTAEAWVSLRFEKAYNIILANGPKRYAGHWELYTERSNGAFAVYVPSNKPSIIRSTRVITDSDWHHVAMVLDGRRVRLYVDGDRVADVPQTMPPREDRKNWALAVGALHERSLRCSGLIDEVRISSCARAVTAAPSVPFSADEHTVRLWSFDRRGPKNGIADSSALSTPERALTLTSWKAVQGVPGQRWRMEPRIRTFTREALRRVVAAFALTTAGLSEAVRPGVLRHWGEEYMEIHATLNGGRRLPKGAAEQVLDRHALVWPEDTDAAGTVLRRTRALLAFMGEQSTGLELADIAADLQRIEDAGRQQRMDRDDVFLAACALRRRLVFRNPLLGFDRVLCIARGTYAGSRLSKMSNRDAEGGHFANQYFGFNTIEGGGLFVVEGFAGTPRVTDLLATAPVENGRRSGRVLDFGSVQGPDLSFDGSAIVFAHCAAREHCWHDWSRDTTWNLFRIGADGSSLRQLTDSAWNDFDPCWLPNGRIAFVSERRGGFIRCFSAYIKVPNYVLHSMAPDGSDITPLSYYETSEWNPSVDNNGMLVYTRWDYTDRENCLGSNIWISYPDGRNPRAPHGNYPYPWHTFPDAPGNLTDHVATDTRSGRPYVEMGVRAIPGSSRYILTGAPHHGEAFGTLCMLDLSVPDDGCMSQLRRITPYTPFPETECGARSQYQYGAPWPLSEDVYLCNSWEDLVVLDRFGNRELLCERELLPCAPDDRLRVTDPIPLYARPRPPVIPTMTRMGEARRPGQPGARICVMNVYDTDVPLPAGTRVKYLRILQNFLKSNHAMGRPMGGYQNENVPRMPLGLVPVEDDGSAYFHAPPGKELMFQLVDENYMAVHTMRSVAYVHTGEMLTCAGCHEPTHSATRRSPGAVKAVEREPSVPEPELGRLEPISYFRHIKPLADRLCVTCHQASGKGLAAMAYQDLKPYVFYFAGGMSRTTLKPMHGGSRSVPGHVGARASKLGAAMLRHRRAGRVPEPAYRTVVLWLDANCPRLTALHRERDQIAGEFVWPKLDVDPLDPLGLEGSAGENTSARILASAALWHPAGPERLLGTTRRFVVTDHTNDRACIIGSDGSVEWSYTCDHPQDVWMLPSGNVLVAWRHAVQEIAPDLKAGQGGSVVWEYRVEAPDEIPSCQPLPGGTVLIGVCGPCKLLEVNRLGQVLTEVQLQSDAPTHSQFRFCRKTPEGTYLVPFLADKVVREFDAQGNVLRAIDWPHPVVTVTRLENGNTLVGGGKLIREISADGTVVWELDQDDLGYQVNLNLIAGVRRLADGNTLVVNWGARGGRREAAQMFEVTPDFKIVWRVWDNPALGSLAQAQVLGK